MGLYSSFDPSQYYDDEPVKKETKKSQPEQEIKKPNAPAISETKRKSLYDEAKKVASSKSDYKGPNFKDVYRVGQRVAVRGADGVVRTAKGRIAEIVEKNLMYVYMEDTFEDVNGQYVADFLTDKDTIMPL